MSNTKSSKRFEEWEEVKCEECEHYWNSSCDAMDTRKTSQNGLKTPCNSFLPTRNVKIPQEIKSLKRAIFWLSVWCIILAILIFLVLLLVIALWK